MVVERSQEMWGGHLNTDIFKEHSAQLSEVEADCAAWRAFFKKSTKPLAEANARPLHEFYGFKELSFESSGDEFCVRALIQQLLLPTKETVFEFVREGLFDRCFWVTFPINYFVETSSKAKVKIGFERAIVLSVSSFRLEHVKRFGKRWGRLYLIDPRVATGRFHGKCQVAERKDFPEESCRVGMFEELFRKVMEDSDRYLFSVTEDPLVDSLLCSRQEPSFVTT
jgi:hypothetical protein